jgi:NAD(P)H-quinone oxidoreductase subunit 4
MDYGPRDIFILIYLFLPIIGIGAYPNPILFLSDDGVEVSSSRSFHPWNEWKKIIFVLSE